MLRIVFLQFYLNQQLLLQFFHLIGAERLINIDDKLIKNDQQVQINSQMNEITIEGTEHRNIEELLQNIQYSKYLPKIWTFKKKSYRGVGEG
jgi:hypothetical protein